MSDLTLQAKIDALPEHLKKRVAEYVDFLLAGKKLKESQASPNKPRPVFGSAKGMFVMAPDFDEPLDDFKEYMY